MRFWRQVMTPAPEADLLHGASISCRSCGAPVSGLSDLRTITCGHCRASMPLDDTARSRLGQYAATLSRAESKARCILREQMYAHLLPALLFRMNVALLGSMAILFVPVPIVMLAGCAMLFGDTSDAMKVVGIVVLLADTLLAVVVFPLGLIVAYRMSAQAQVDAARLAKLSSNTVDATLPATCGRCGGQARVVAIGRQPPRPCPWCAATMIARSAESADVAVQALLDAQQTTVDERLLRARIRGGVRSANKYRRDVPGFEFSGGIFESPRLPGAWISIEYNTRGMLQRVELDRPVTIPGRVFFVRREMAEAHSAECAEIRLPRPPVAHDVDPELARSFVVFADPEVVVGSVVAHAGIQNLLWSMNAAESLHLDPGGASCWSIGRKRSSAGLAHRRAAALEHALG